MKKFTNNQNLMYVYDWEKDLHYRVKPGKENYKSYFYDINPKFIKLILDIENGYDELVDDTIRKLHEEVIGRVFNEITTKLRDENNRENININEENLHKIIQFIILQNIRTPWFREKISYMAVNFLFHFSTELENENINENEVIQVIHNIMLYMISKMFNGDIISWPKKSELFFNFFLEEQMDFYIDLLNSSKLFLINDTSMPFITTDNPINIERSGGYEYGMLLTPSHGESETIHRISKSPLRTVFLPISSEIGIYFLNSKYDESFQVYNNKIGIINEEKIEMVHNINLSMASKSKEKVYCKDNKFSELKRMIRNKSSVKIMLNFN